MSINPVVVDQPEGGQPERTQPVQQPEAQPQPEPTVKTLAEQLKAANEALAAERQKNLEQRQKSEADQTNLRAQLVKAQARTNLGQTVPSTGWQQRNRDRAIQAVGGLAYWSKLTLAQKLNAMGEAPATDVEIQTAKRLFSGAASKEAAAFHQQDPVAYARLRVIAAEIR